MESGIIQGTYRLIIREGGRKHAGLFAPTSFLLRLLLERYYFGSRLRRVSDIGRIDEGREGVRRPPICVTQST